MEPKYLIINCPHCDAKASVMHISELSEIVGCKLGCSGCGRRLVVEPPGKLVVEDDSKHQGYNKSLPKG